MSYNSSMYKCESCGNEDEYVKDNIMDNFPQKIICIKCGKDSYRIWGVSAHDIAQGKAGNFKDKWTGGIFNHSSVLGKYKGTKVK